MADINQETERLAELMAEVNRQMADFGMVTQDTQRRLYDVQIKAKYGFNNASEALENAGKAAGNLAKAGTEAAKAMYNNQKGATAFGGTLDHLSTAATAAGAALMLLGGPITMLVGGLAMLTGGVIKLGKVAGEQSDALFKGFQDLSRSGGAASDGITGLFGDIQKLGLGFQDLESYTRLIAESNKELALFGGSVIRGRRQFADMGAAMEPFRESLFNAGITQEEINEASMGYLRLQSRIGQTQNKTAQELADGARRYLIEQDALTKLTGMTRKEQEDAREEIRSQERFAAKLMEMRAKDQHQEADELEAAYLILKSQSKEAAQGFADVSTGMLTTEAAQKSYLATQGESMKTAQQIQAGQLTAAQGAQRVAAAHGRTADALGVSLGQMGIYNQTFGDLAADLRLKGMSEADIEAQLKKVKEEQIAQGVTGKKAADSAQQAQTDLRLSQQKTMLAMQRMVNHAVEPATSAIAAFTKAVEKATLALTKLLGFFGIGDKTQGKTQEEIDTANARAAREREVMDLQWKVANARSENDKKVAKTELEAAKRRLLDAEVAEKYAKDRATGRTGAGIGGTQLRADGSEIRPGDEDYTPPRPAAASGGGGSAAAVPAVGGGGGVNEAERQMQSRELFNFLGGVSGNESNYNRLDSQFRERLTAMAKEYQGLTRKKLDFGSGARNERENLQVGGVGTSNHLTGTAVDLSTESVNELIRLNLLGKYGFKQNPKSAWHISDTGYADGGIATGPTTGYNALLHGTEAVVPLPNGKTIPVSLDMKNVMQPGGIGPTFAGMNEYTGYNMGHMSTDLAAIKDIAAKLGAYDASTKMITDPNLWKQILSSGIAMNYDLGVAEIGTKMIPGIGAEIGERIQELKSTGGTDTATAIKQVAQEFRTAMIDVVQNMGNGNNTLAGEQLAMLSQLVREQQNSNDLQKKMLQVAAN
jgi:hypothetical protein